MRMQNVDCRMQSAKAKNGGVRRILKFAFCILHFESNNSPQLAAGTLLMGNPKGASIPFGRVRG